MMRRLILLGSIGLALIAGPASAHGDIQSTSPEDGERLEDRPNVVRIFFTEAPTADARFEVLDGCGEDVLASVGGEGPNIELFIEDRGATGRWEVSYRVISSVDGHSSKGAFSFRVRGRQRCLLSPASPDPDTSIGGGGAPIANDELPANDFPVVPVLIGGGAIVAVAVAVRLLASR